MIICLSATSVLLAVVFASATETQPDGRTKTLTGKVKAQWDWPLKACFDVDGSIVVAWLDTSAKSGKRLELAHRDRSTKGQPVDRILHTLVGSYRSDHQLASSFEDTADCGFGYGCVWVSGQAIFSMHGIRRIPIEEAILFADKQSVPEELHWKYPKNGMRLMENYTLPVLPKYTDSIVGSLGGRFGERLNSMPAPFYFVPTSATTGRLSTINGEYDYRASYSHRDNKWVANSVAVKTWSAGGTEPPFWHYRAGGSYFKLKGRTLLKTNEKAQGKYLPIWNDPNQPILVVATDLTTEKTWCFGRSSGDGRPFYFVVAPELIVHYGTEPFQIEHGASPLDAAEKFLALKKKDDGNTCSSRRLERLSYHRLVVYAK